ncbi:MAG: Na+/H+ antiporter NhaC family protein [Kiritimatiellae bacterium]|nr:Na+/H+ antiporter NhaC family protein [Kiritimatiellia bacterium]
MKSNPLALLPFLVFAVFYVGLSAAAGGFYSVPMPAAFAVASASAFLIVRKGGFSGKVETFARGMGHPDIMTMALIFILAGAFTSVAKATGGVGAAVTIAQSLMPAKLMLAGLFLVSCIVSLALGTSCGTIAALTPIALGFVPATGVDAVVPVGAVVGGAMFGDNLSLISDTTVAATRTQGIAMRGKFLANIKIAAPAAAATLLLYAFLGRSAPDAPAAVAAGWREAVLFTPYVLILALALAGVNVMVLLFAGTVLSAALGVAFGEFTCIEAVGCAGRGMLGMSETLIVAMLAGGLFAVIREAGGIAALVNAAGRVMRGPRSCQAGISFLTAAVNAFTANNTVAIVIAGPVAKECAVKRGVSPARTAALLDTVSCIVQGVIPYGAQMLLALGAAHTAGTPVGGLSLIGRMYYPAILSVAVAVAIALPESVRAKSGRDMI